MQAPQDAIHTPVVWLISASQWRSALPVLEGAQASDTFAFCGNSVPTLGNLTKLLSELNLSAADSKRVLIVSDDQAVKAMFDNVVVDIKDLAQLVNDAAKVISI